MLEVVISYMLEVVISYMLEVVISYMQVRWHSTWNQLQFHGE